MVSTLEAGPDGTTHSEASPARPLMFIPDILQRHLEELGFLWTKRAASLGSPEWALRDLWRLEERMSRHLNGILVVGEAGDPLIFEALSGDDRGLAFAGAFALLQRGRPGDADIIFDHLISAAGDAGAGIRSALCHGSISDIEGRLFELYRDSELTLSAVAAEVLAAHNLLKVGAAALDPYLAADEPSIRVTGWRLVADIGARIDAKAYAKAMRDSVSRVRREAIHASAWCREPGALAVARALARERNAEDIDALEMLGILGTEGDFRLIDAIARDEQLGPGRFRVVAAYGHPALIELVLAAVEESDGETALAAARAFTRLTGCEIESVEQARAHWSDVIEARVGGAARICGGFDVHAGLDGEALTEIDLEARWHVLLRAKYYGSWGGSPLSLRVYPQR